MQNLIVANTDRIHRQLGWCTAQIFGAIFAALEAIPAPLLRKPFSEVLPRARYVGLERSEYLCSRYGWTRGSVVDHAARHQSDLVVCYDVLQYLDDRDAGRAIANLARLTRSAVYV